MVEKIPELEGRADMRAFDGFLGEWSVRRLIVDRKARSNYRFEGSAVLHPSSFVESGTICYGETSLKSERSYKLRHGENRLEILFTDGRLFVPLGNSPVQDVYHLCGEDQYTGRFFFAADGGWAELWRVKGPRKNYASLARYSRPAT